VLVAQAQRDLLETRIAESQAIVDYRIALVGLYRAEGSLLDRRGVAIVAAPAPAALR
jgi:outer membrane protein TolC